MRNVAELCQRISESVSEFLRGLEAVEHSLATHDLDDDLIVQRLRDATDAEGLDEPGYGHGV